MIRLRVSGTFGPETDLRNSLMRQARGRPEAGRRQAFIQNHEAVGLPWVRADLEA